VKFKPGDILYCYTPGRSNWPSCECVVQVIRKKDVEPGSGTDPGYHVEPMTSGACTTIHDKFCARRAIKVSEEFAKYLDLFEPNTFNRWLNV